MARGKARGKDRHGPGRPVDDGGGNTDAWLGTYADAITLLMAFFMMLYAMSQIDQVKFEGLIAGFAVPFGNDNGSNQGQDLLEAGDGLVGDLLERAQQDPTVAIDQPFEQIEAAFDEAVAVQLTEASPGPGGADAETGGERPLIELPAGFVIEDDLEDVDQVEIVQDRDGLPILAATQLAEVKERLRQALAGTPFEDDVFTVLTTHGLVVTINADDVLFPSGSAVFGTTGEEVLAILGPVFADFGNEILIEGHTDDVSLDRVGYSNWNLSTDRAVAVVNHLARDHAVAQRRLAAIGYGEFRPKVPNDTAANRALNRRVEIVIIAGGS